MNCSSFVLGLLFLLGTSSALFGQSGAGGGQNPPGTAEVRTLSERVPAGGTVQVKFLLTQPRPISSGGAGTPVNGFTVDGVFIFSPMGDAAGAAVVQNGSLFISVISPLSDFGTNLDYPFLAVTMDIPSTVRPGSTFPLALTADSSFQTPTGPLTFVEPKPGMLTIAGSVSVRGVYPGGGSWPAGTVIRVQGTGFQPNTKIATKMKASQATYIGPGEMRFTLLQPATLDMQPIQVTNPDGSQVTYYSYLRGAPIQSPSRPLLQKTEPIFPIRTYSTAVIGPLPLNGPGQFTALAIQNPGTMPVTLTMTIQSSGATTMVTLPSGGRLMDEISAILGGANLLEGDVVTVNATSAVQIIGINADENTGTVIPFLPFVM